MIVEEIMTEGPITVTETTTIGDAMSTMAEQGVRHLPVVRGERSEDVIGILSDRDFSNLGLSLVNDVESYDQLRARLTEPVSVLMTADPVTIDQDASVAEVIDMMTDDKLSAIPVVESGTQRLVGIVSYVDVLKAARDRLDD
ncbi:MAG: CBS domain-containing protein [Myxococcales bacterium]|nr:CBS domain-containing protein [Myxococcales bacterium]